MRNKFRLSAATIILGTLLIAGEVVANPAGVPVAASPPLSCSTFNFTITTNFGSPVSTQYPVPDVCNGEPCTKYGYFISSPTLQNIDHAVFSVSATQDLFFSSPVSTAYPLGAGDNVTGFLAGSQHEYAIRFNNSQTKSEMVFITTKGISKPQLGTILVRSGSKGGESCRIATPGITTDTFQPVFQSQTALVAGGKCSANLVFDASGNVIDVTTSTPGCTVGSPGASTNFQIIVNGAPLKNNSGPHGITFGNGTSTCYGPPVPSVPKCICTALPCP